MALELVDELGVPADHPFCREGLMAWWFVPAQHEPAYLRVLGHVWTHAVTPSLACAILAFFQAVISPRDFQLFWGHMQALLDSRAIQTRDCTRSLDT